MVTVIVALPEPAVTEKDVSHAGLFEEDIDQSPLQVIVNCPVLPDAFAMLSSEGETVTGAYDSPLAACTMLSILLDFPDVNVTEYVFCCFVVFSGIVIVTAVVPLVPLLGLTLTELSLAEAVQLDADVTEI